MSSSDAPPFSVGSPAGAPATWSADLARADDEGVAAVASSWTDLTRAYLASGADETTMNSPCL